MDAGLHFYGDASCGLCCMFGLSSQGFRDSGSRFLAWKKLLNASGNIFTKLKVRLRFDLRPSGEGQLRVRPRSSTYYLDGVFKRASVRFAHLEFKCCCALESVV